jgi:hypothetical protein
MSEDEMKQLVLDRVLARLDISKAGNLPAPRLRSELRPALELLLESEHPQFPVTSRPALIDDVLDTLAALIAERHPPTVETTTPLGYEETKQVVVRVLRNGVPANQTPAPGDPDGSRSGPSPAQREAWRPLVENLLDMMNSSLEGTTRDTLVADVLDSLFEPNRED